MPIFLLIRLSSCSDFFVFQSFSAYVRINQSEALTEKIFNVFDKFMFFGENALQTLLFLL